MGRKPTGELRRGWTTGACAAAATKAAYVALLTGRFPDPVAIRLPSGEQPRFDLAETTLRADQAVAAVVKDAGDDPDVTHGALVRVTVRRGESGTGVMFIAGDGVGVVTRPGLALAVGEPAINPAPRRLIREMVADVARDWGDAGDLEVTISIPDGEILARRTTNARLGIVGGLSILGTSGVVIPYSCASWIHAIQRGIDVARAAGLSHVAAATGSTSERAVQALYGLADVALIDMGDFVGGTLKYLRRHPIPQVTVAGGFAERGAAGELVAHARDADSANQVLELAQGSGLPLADDVALRARRVALGQLDGACAIEVMIFDRDGALIGHATGW